MIHFTSGPDEQFLENAGILFRPEYNIGTDGAQAIPAGQIQAFVDLDKKEPGTWALAQGENSLLLKSGVAEDGKGVLVELHRAIPIPAVDVPLNEILEFKEKRKDELILLRHRLDTFVLDVEASAEKQVELQKRVAEVDEACANLLKVGHEWRFPVHLSNIKASITFSPLRFLPAVGGGWKMGESYGLTAASVAAAIAGVTSTIDIKGDLGLRGARRPKSPYRYAYQTHKELF